MSRKLGIMSDMGRNHKFMQVFHENVYHELEAIARKKDVSVQQLLRAVVVPEWLARYRASEALIPTRPVPETVAHRNGNGNSPGRKYLTTLPQSR